MFTNGEKASNKASQTMPRTEKGICGRSLHTMCWLPYLSHSSPTFITFVVYFFFFKDISSSFASKWPKGR